MLRLFIQIGEAKRMILDKIGSNVRKAAGGILGRLFGVMRPFKSPCVKIPRKIGSVESFHPCKQVKIKLYWGSCPRKCLR